MNGFEIYTDDRVTKTSLLWICTRHWVPLMFVGFQTLWATIKIKSNHYYLLASTLDFNLGRYLTWSHEKYIFRSTHEIKLKLKLSDAE